MPASATELVPCRMQPMLSLVHPLRNSAYASYHACRNGYQALNRRVQSPTVMSLPSGGVSLYTSRVRLYTNGGSSVSFIHVNPNKYSSTHKIKPYTIYRQTHLTQGIMGMTSCRCPIMHITTVTCILLS